MIRWMIVGLLATQSLFAALIPGHLPPGLEREVEAGDTLRLLRAQAFQKPDFTSSQGWTAVGAATVLGAREGFYRVRLEEQGTECWVYRSELAVEAAPSRNLPDPYPAIGSGAFEESLPEIPASGDTLSLIGCVFFQQPDLLGKHGYLPGERKMIVLEAENEAGMLRVRQLDGSTGWVHRGELPEEKRRPR